MITQCTKHCSFASLEIKHTGAEITTNIVFSFPYPMASMSDLFLNHIKLSASGFNLHGSEKSH